MNPSEPRLLRVEIAADLPVLWALFQRLDLPATLDRHFPAPIGVGHPARVRQSTGCYIRLQGTLILQR
jgi:hypothetical protein